jgi:hypothetical protein
MLMGLQYGTCFASPFWRLEFRGGSEVPRISAHPLVKWSGELHSLAVLLPGEGSLTRWSCWATESVWMPQTLTLRLWDQMKGIGLIFDIIFGLVLGPILHPKRNVLAFLCEFLVRN